MLTKQGVALTFYAFYVASKQGKTGLTVTLDIYETTSGSPIVSAASATELGGGLYYYTLASGSVDASGAYVAVFKTSDSSVDQQHIPAIWVTDTELKHLDADISTRSTVTTAEVNAEVDTALSDVGLTTTVTGRIDAAISTRNAVAPLDASATQTAAESALAAYDAATGADVSGISVPSAASVADAVWDESLAGHATAGSAGALLTASGAASDPLLNTVPGSYASGTAGYVLGSINPAQVTVTSPVATDGTSITIVRGDDYLNTDGRAITFTGSTWPDISGGSVDLVVDVSGTPTRYAATITGAGSCYVELTTTDTTALSPKKTYGYDLEATLSNASIVTLVQGRLLVVEDVR